jgi:hypothetical protein
MQKYLYFKKKILAAGDYLNIFYLWFFYFFDILLCQKSVKHRDKSHQTALYGIVAQLYRPLNRLKYSIFSTLFSDYFFKLIKSKI